MNFFFSSGLHLGDFFMLLDVVGVSIVLQNSIDSFIGQLLVSSQVCFLYFFQFFKSQSIGAGVIMAIFPPYLLFWRISKGDIKMEISSCLFCFLRGTPTFDDGFSQLFPRVKPPPLLSAFLPSPYPQPQQWRLC